jgi:hypothetical protein
VPQTEVVGDRGRTGIHAEINELLAERHDLVLELRRCSVRDPVRGPGPRLQRLLTGGSIPGDQLAGPALGHTVGPGDLPVAPALQQHRLDHVPRQLHRGPPTQVSTMLRHMCPLSGELRHCRGHWGEIVESLAGSALLRISAGARQTPRSASWDEMSASAATAALRLWLPGPNARAALQAARVAIGGCPPWV